MNWKELLRNKKMLYGVGAAGALGLVVLLMRKKQPGGDGEPPNDVAGGTTTLQPGTYDSTGSDIYNGLQALYAGQDARWQELILALGDVKSKLPNRPPTPQVPTNPGPQKPFSGFKRNAPGTSAIPIKTLATPPGSVGRWSWENLVGMFYDTRGASQGQISAAAAKLRDANMWRWKDSTPSTGPYTASTVAGGQPVLVPVSL